MEQLLLSLANTLPIAVHIWRSNERALSFIRRVLFHPESPRTSLSDAAKCVRRDEAPIHVHHVGRQHISGRRRAAAKKIPPHGKPIAYYISGWVRGLQWGCQVDLDKKRDLVCGGFAPYKMRMKKPHWKNFQARYSLHKLLLRACTVRVSQEAATTRKRGGR